jgi:hypothetical protein
MCLRSNLLRKVQILQVKVRSIIIVVIFIIIIIIINFYVSETQKLTESINKIGSALTDSWFHSMATMKKLRISNVTLNMTNDTISIVEPGATLTLHPNRYVNPETVEANYPHYNYRYSLEDSNSGDLIYDAHYSQKKFKEINTTAISVAKDLHDLLKCLSKLPRNPPTRDNSIFSKKNYRTALLDHLKIVHRNNTEFQFFKGSRRIDEGNKASDNIDNILDIESTTLLEASPICVQEVTSFSTLTEDFEKIATKLAERIFHSVSGEAKEQSNKEMSRRKELRFHVETFKAYVLLQAFCASNLTREQGETKKSQAKILITQYFPQISLPNMNLMLQRAPRIYRLLLLANGDWRFIDAFEELTPSFIKSAMNSAANFEIWLNLVKTGKIINYEEGPTMRERGKEELKRFKLEIIKSYFNDVDDDRLKELIEDDDDEN